MLVSCVSGAQLSSYATFLTDPHMAPLRSLSTTTEVVVTPTLSLLLIGKKLPVDVKGMVSSITQIVVAPITSGLLLNMLMYMCMHRFHILKSGFFHADPHPGNLAIDIDGSLFYYDFGMMGEIKTFTRERLLEMLYAVYEKDVDKVIKCLVELEALQPTGDLPPVRRSINFYLNNLLNQTLDQQQTLVGIGEDLFAIEIDQPFRFPATFTFVLRAFSTLEGVSYTLDPDFSFVKVTAPYAQELLDIRQRRSSGIELVEEIRKQANDELLDIRQRRSSGTELVEEIRKQANDARKDTISMLYRI